MVDRGKGREPPIDALFRANAARHPDSLALIDPPDIEAVTGKARQRLTFAQADAKIAALAFLLREIGTPEGSTVAIQLPNNADSVIAMLAVMRAGMVPAFLPLLWRRAECVAALSRCHAKAILCCSRVGEFDHGQLALEIAAEVFPIRAVCGVGPNLADGIVAIDEIGLSGIAHVQSRAPVAAITFDTAGDSPKPIERDAARLLSAGLLIGQLSGVSVGARLLSTIPIASHAAIASALIPWLMSGGPLSLHHPFSSRILSRQIDESDIVILPDAVATRLQQAGLLGSQLRAVISICRSPERFTPGPRWLQPELPLVDVVAFGELALLARLRPADGAPAPWPQHIRSAEGDGDAARAYVTPAGTLGIDGALAAAPDTDTRYPCRMDQLGITVTAAPAGVANVGGYRFAMRELQQAISTIDGDGILTALPHSLTGHRLAGNSADPEAMRQTLNSFGLGPLVTGAFRDRMPPA